MERILTGEDIQAFYAWLKAEEKSQNTIEKYARDVATFVKFLGKDNITKEITPLCSRAQNYVRRHICHSKRQTNEPY